MGIPLEDFFLSHTKDNTLFKNAYYHHHFREEEEGEETRNGNDSAFEFIDETPTEVRQRRVYRNQINNNSANANAN